MTIRTATEADLDALLELERECITPPWTEGQLLAELLNGDTYIVAAQEETEILGFAVLRRMGGEAELFRVAVQAAARRRGIASALMENVLSAAENAEIESVFLEVRASNAAAIALYEKHGFAAVGRRRGYYDAPVEDAAVMRWGK